MDNGDNLLHVTRIMLPFIYKDKSAYSSSLISQCAEGYVLSCPWASIFCDQQGSLGSEWGFIAREQKDKQKVEIFIDGSSTTSDAFT